MLGGQTHISEVSEPLLWWLRTQLDSLQLVTGGHTAVALTARPRPSQWSASENVAHLARYHQVFLARLERILVEDRATLPSYQAEEDPEWPKWAEMPSRLMIQRLQELRSLVVQRVSALSPDQLKRTAVHPAFGELDVRAWLRFFLVHEGHHLYIAMLRAHPRP